MHARTSAGSLLMILLASASFGCSAIEDAVGIDDEAARVSPKDDENLGKLAVNPPANYNLSPDPRNRDAELTWMPTRSDVLLGGSLRTQAVDAGCLQVSSPMLGATNMCGIAIAKKKTTTVALGAMRPVFDPKKVEVDFGPKPVYRATFLPTNGQPNEEYELHKLQAISETPFWAGTSATPAIAAPATYKFAWSLDVLGTFTKVLAENETADVQLVPNDVRATIVITPPAKRELPNATPYCQTKDRTLIIQRDTASGYPEPNGYDQVAYDRNPAQYPNGYIQATRDGITAWRALPMQATTTIRVFPFTANEGDKHYEIVVNGIVQNLDVKPGKTTNVKLERLDVDPVEVTREDGTKYMQSGTYEVYRNVNGTWQPLQRRVGQFSDCSGGDRIVEATFGTGTGLDLLPGQYKVVVSYSTEENANKTQEFVVNL